MNTQLRNRALWNPLAIARKLRCIGLMGIGQRNADYVLRYNPRKFYQRVDDKLLTKKLAIAAGLPVPDLYAVVREEHQIADLHATLACRDSFVVKPAHGSGGDGILVIHGRKRGGRDDDHYRRSSGHLMSRGEFEHHLSNGLSGLFSLGGQPDQRLLRVWMFAHDLGAEHAATGGSARQVDAYTDRALVQVGLAVRQSRRQADHRHHRITEKHDDADIGHALVADMLEHRIELHAVFDQQVVGLAAEREES